MSQSNTESHDLKGWKLRFFTIWTGQAFSLLGSQLVQFALVWYLTKTTGSATVLATATLVALLPQILLGPLAGTLIDRWNRRAVMIVADSGIALATLLLLYLFASGNVQVWHVYALMLVRSAGGAFHFPAMTASTSLMVPQQQLSRVAGINQALQGGINIVAPPLGALLLEALPMQGILAIDLGTALIAILPLVFISIPQPKRKTPDGEQKPSVWREFVEGLRYVRAWPGLMILIGMAMLLNFVFTPAGALMPLLVSDYFGGDAGHFAAMEASFGIGVVVGGVALGIWGGFRRRILTSLLGLFGMSIGMLMVGLAPATVILIAIAGFLLVGIMQPITNGPIFAVIQAGVAPEMQGRVLTLLMSGAIAISPLSLAVTGPLADAIGIQNFYRIAGLICLLTALVAPFIPALLNIEEQKARADAEAPAQDADAAVLPNEVPAQPA